MTAREKASGTPKGLNLTFVHGRERELERNMHWLWTQIELRLKDLLGQVPSPHQVCFPICQV